MSYLDYPINFFYVYDRKKIKTLDKTKLKKIKRKLYLYSGKLNETPDKIVEREEQVYVTDYYNYNRLGQIESINHFRLDKDVYLFGIIHDFPKSEQCDCHHGIMDFLESVIKSNHTKPIHLFLEMFNHKKYRTEKEFIKSDKISVIDLLTEKFQDCININKCLYLKKHNISIHYVDYRDAFHILYFIRTFDKLALSLENEEPMNPENIQDIIKIFTFIESKGFNEFFKKIILSKNVIEEIENIFGLEIIENLWMKIGFSKKEIQEILQDYENELLTLLNKSKIKDKILYFINQQIFELETELNKIKKDFKISKFQEYSEKDQKLIILMFVDLLLLIMNIVMDIYTIALLFQDDIKYALIITGSIHSERIIKFLKLIKFKEFDKVEKIDEDCYCLDTRKLAQPLFQSRINV